MTYYQPFQTIGFHSCDRDIGLKVLNGELDLRPSENSWDWLGGGVYFWEQNPGRALEYANECATGVQKNKIKITTPFVIGAVVELGNCLNLVESNSLAVVKEAYQSLEEASSDLNASIPVNKGAKRELDCAVINYVHLLVKKIGDKPYDTVRCAFQEGGEIYKGSNFTDRLHVELCVINTDLIKGYFLPRPIEMFNPFLQKVA